MTKRRAKEIFFNSNGVYYFMAHDGFYEEYKEYNVDKETEEKWTKELIKSRLKEFKKTGENVYLSPLVEYYNQYELLDELLAVNFKKAYHGKPYYYLSRLATIEMLSKLMSRNKSKILNYKDKKGILKSAIAEFIQECIPKVDNPEHCMQRLEKVKRRLR